mgnify:CR=1 FL=1
MSCCDNPAMSRPSICTEPENGINPSTALPVVDLPEPLSPTRPIVSPGMMSKEMPSTVAGGALRLKIRPDAPP